MITDEELYARFLCGEDDGLRELMDRHMNRLTLFCFTFLHSVTEAEEMALDAFAVVALRKSLWRGGSFQGWLYRIARNLSISRYRTLRMNQMNLGAAQCLAASSAEAVYLQQEERQEVLAHLSRLPEGERRVLTLLYLENISYAQSWAWIKKKWITWPIAGKRGCANGYVRRKGNMHELLTCCLIAVLAFLFGVVAAMLVKTLHMETKQHGRNDSL